jgi:hypothetical protein
MLHAKIWTKSNVVLRNITQLPLAEIWMGDLRTLHISYRNYFNID